MTKIIVLTTETTHHSKFCEVLQTSSNDLLAVVESHSIAPPFDVYHSYQDLQNEYEINTFFEGKNKPISDFVDVLNVDEINGTKSVEVISKFQPDLIFCFGTSKIKSPIIEKFQGRILNLHGGNPEMYRGLDSHLWTIYHSDFNNLVSCLHLLEAQLDTGSIVDKKQLPISSGMKIWQLRAENTKVCIEMSVDAIRNFEVKKKVKAQPQLSKGRYYSFMPKVLKDICVKKFEKHTSAIDSKL